jgi:hypothetical protein
VPTAFIMVVARRAEGAEGGDVAGFASLAPSARPST